MKNTAVQHLCGENVFRAFQQCYKLMLRDSLREFLLPPLCMSVILSVNIKSHKVLNDR